MHKLCRSTNACPDYTKKIDRLNPRAFFVPDALKQCRLFDQPRRWGKGAVWIGLTALSPRALAEPIEILYERTGTESVESVIWGWLAIIVILLLLGALATLYRYHRSRMRSYRDELELARARLREAQLIARVGSWSRNFETGETFWSEEACKLLGLKGREGRFHHYERLIHPDDLDRVTEVIASAYHQGGGYQCDHRVLIADQGERHVRLSGQVYLGEDGAPVRETGTIQDITEHQLAQGFNQVNERRLRAVLDAMPVPVLILEDIEVWTVLYANRSAYALFGVDTSAPADDIRLRNLWADADEMASFIGAVRQQDGTVTQEHRLRALDAREFWADVTGKRITLADVRGILICMVDITARLEAQRELERLATTDQLTGCLNRRSFLAGMQRELKRSIRHRQAFSVLLLDIDHFKRVNERYGHGLGDEVIRRFCDVVWDSLREEDLLGRLGGEEFAVVLVAAEQDGGYLVAERIRRRWQDESFEWQGIHSNFTVSIGVAQLQSEDDKVDEMLERAERGLASAKQAGRNCVIVHNGDGAAA